MKIDRGLPWQRCSVKILGVWPIERHCNSIYAIRVTRRYNVCSACCCATKRINSNTVRMALKGNKNRKESDDTMECEQRREIGFEKYQKTKRCFFFFFLFFVEFRFSCILWSLDSIIL